MMDTKKLIMVVEDDSYIRRMACHILKNAGFHTIIEAADGSEALGMLLEGKMKPDLILSDIQMKNMDGINLAKQLKEHGLEFPLIFMSGDLGKYGHADLVQHTVYLIQKPFDVQKFMAIIEAALAPPPPLPASGPAI